MWLKKEYIQTSLKIYFIALLLAWVNCLQNIIKKKKKAKKHVVEKGRYYRVLNVCSCVFQTSFSTESEEIWRDTVIIIQKTWKWPYKQWNLEQWTPIRLLDIFMYLVVLLLIEFIKKQWNLSWTLPNGNSTLQSDEIFWYEFARIWIAE